MRKSISQPLGVKCVTETKGKRHTAGYLKFKTMYLGITKRYIYTRTIFADK